MLWFLPVFLVAFFLFMTEPAAWYCLCNFQPYMSHAVVTDCVNVYGPEALRFFGIKTATVPLSDPRGASSGLRPANGKACSKIYSIFTYFLFLLTSVKQDSTYKSIELQTLHKM